MAKKGRKRGNKKATTAKGKKNIAKGKKVNVLEIEEP